MTSKLFGCVISSLNNIIIVGQPSVGQKGCFQVYKTNKIENSELNDSVNIESIGSYKPIDGHVDDGFGISCKIVEDDNDSFRNLLIVGSHRHFEYGMIVGAVYIYESLDKGHTWKFMSKLLPHKFNHKTLFGCSVDINSNIAVVGSFADNTEGWKVGSVHLFKYHEDTNWTHHRVLYPNMLIDNSNFLSSHFGFSVSLSKNFLAIGAPGEESNSSVYLFYSDNNWNGELKSHRIKEQNKYGFSVVINNHTLFVGSPAENGIEGTVFTYDLSNFFDTSIGFLPAENKSLVVKKITTNHNSSKALFGRSIHSYKNMLIISGFGKYDDDAHKGSVFIYKKIDNDYTLLANLKDSQAKELFGHSVCINGEYAFIGDPSDDKVHVYLLNDIIGGNLKKWYGSSIVLKPISSYSLEI